MAIQSIKTNLSQTRKWGLQPKVLDRTMRARRYHQRRPKVHPYCSLLQFGLRAQLRTGRVVFKWPYLIPVKKTRQLDMFVSCTTETAQSYYSIQI